MAATRQFLNFPGAKVTRFAPINLGAWITWSATAILFLVLPLIFSGGFAVTLLSQMGTMIIFALSYNMLFGQGGMLSFGHAVYSGLGAFFAMHALNWASAGSAVWQSPWFVAMSPLIGGVFGAIFGVLFGYVTTKKAGTPFAMITMGLGEMVFAASLMFPDFFGGEGGITGNRVLGQPILGINFGPALQVYYLIAIYTFFCIVAMYAFSQTPLGRISNAVRENPERVEFFGYNTQRVRFLVLIVSAFFAGISGGLSAINFEIVSAENVHAIRSGGVLLATFIGGALFFFGPILGAVVFVFLAVALSEFTKAWMIYLGVFFVLMVMFAPGGLAGIILTNLRVAKFGKFGLLKKAYYGLIPAGLVLIVVISGLIEMIYHLALETASGSMVKVFGLQVDTSSGLAWAVALAVLMATVAVFEVFRRRFTAAWGQAQEQIEELRARGLAA